jgi:hypothetical protein
MKQALTFLILLSSFCSFSQYTPVYNPIKWKKGRFDTLRIPFSDTVRPKDDLTPGQMMIAPDKVVYVWDGAKYVTLGSGDGGSFQLGYDTNFIKAPLNVLSINTRGLNNYAGTINVRDYGAKGDGVTDDYLYIQSAFNAAKDGATVIFPSGYTFYTSGGLNVNKRVSIIATGAVIRLKNSSTVKGMLSLNAKGSTVTGGTWDANKATNTGNILGEDPYNYWTINFNDDSCAVKNASLTNVWGIGIKSTSKSYGLVDNCDVNSDIFAIFFDGLTGSSPTGNKVTNSRFYQRNSTKYGQAVLMTAVAPDAQMGFEISNNVGYGRIDTIGFNGTVDGAIAYAARGKQGKVTNNIAHGYVMGFSEGGDYTSVTGNYFDSLVGTRYGIEPSGKGVLISGNTIKDADYGITLNTGINDYDFSTITSNNITAKRGIFLQIAPGRTGRNITVANNTLNITDAGISTARDVTGISISGNTITGQGSNIANSRGVFFNSPPKSAYLSIVNNVISKVERAYSIYSLTLDTFSHLTSANVINNDVGQADQGWSVEANARLGLHVTSRDITQIGGRKQYIDQATNTYIEWSNTFATPQGNQDGGIGSLWISLIDGSIYKKFQPTANGWGRLDQQPLSLPIGTPSYLQRVNTAGTGLENALISAPFNNHHIAIEAPSLILANGSLSKISEGDGITLGFDTLNNVGHIQTFRGAELGLNSISNNPVRINGVPFQSIGGVMTIGAKVAGQDATASNQFTTLGQVTSLTSGNIKVLPDANYTILSSDRVLILNEPASARTITLPAASTLPNKEITLIVKTTTAGRWILSGSFIQQPGANTTEDFINSGLNAITYRLASDGNKWYQE